MEAYKNSFKKPPDDTLDTHFVKTPQKTAILGTPHLHITKKH
jgi:hypothetical protein